MELIKVDSSMIYAFGYDADKQQLDVVFHKNGVYCYEGVPQKAYEGLLAAESKGSYMRNNIIDSYPYHRSSETRR